jgi:hypothetical protein
MEALASTRAMRRHASAGLYIVQNARQFPFTVVTNGGEKAQIRRAAAVCNAHVPG